MEEKVKLGMIRSEIPVTENFIYLNAGMEGPPCKRAIQVVSEWQHMQMSHGPSSPHMIEKMTDKVEETRGKVARFLGVQEGEVVLTRSVTEGINIIANGLPLARGDEVVITDLEHPGGILPWYVQQHNSRFGVKVAKLSDIEIDASNIGDQVLERIENSISTRTKIVFVSHITYADGWVLPIKEIASMVHKKGIMLFIDGAHSAGQIPIDVSRMDCDFFVTAGHKWLLGPMGTGVLYVKNNWIDRLQFSFIMCDSVIRYDFEGNFEPVSAAKRFESFGHARDGAPLIGLRAAIDFLEEANLTWIYKRIPRLASYLKDSLTDVPSVKIFTPRSEKWSAGSVNFTVVGVEPGDLLTHLFSKWKIILRCAGKGVRICTHFFNTEQELNRLIEALKDASKRGLCL